MAMKYLYDILKKQFPEGKNNKRTSMPNSIVSILTLLLGLIIISSMNLNAQNFRNQPGGVYQGSGLFKVKEQATGLPDTVTGTFEYFGADQNVESRNFENLLLTGNGTKTTGNVSILRTVAIADGIRFQIDTTMLLEKNEGRITSEAGLIIGKVVKSVDLLNMPDSSDFGGIGLTIKSENTPPGTTEIIRTSGPSGVINYGGSNSIQRLYEVKPTNTIDLNGTIYFRYSRDELIGNDSLTLDIWRSPDGINWRRQRTSRNSNTLIRSGKFLSGYWTAADANNLLGRPNYEFDPDSIMAVSSDSLRGRVNNLLDSMFIAQITDIFGNPIPNAQVRFEVTDWPAEAVGFEVSDTLTTTDNSGIVQTRLKLGNKVGRYTVTAQVVSVPTVQINFYGYATSGIYSLQIAGYPPSDTVRNIVDAPFIVQALDEFNGGVSYTGLRFTITPPLGSTATTQRIVTADTIADVNGFARATVQLGEKVGVYTVEARSKENDSIYATIQIQATHGIPALSWQRSNVEYTDTIGSVLPRFVYAITDMDTNSVGGNNIVFTIESKPLDATGDSLIDPIVVTDPSTGEASVALRLGNKVGQYVVRAEDPTVPGSALFYIGNALPGLATTLAYNDGRDQITEILDTLNNPFVVRVSDMGGNSIAGVPVTFSIVDTPAGSWGHAVMKAVDTTDANGYARTYLRLGSKVGRYQVNASSPAISYSIVPFEAIAIAGKPTTIAQRDGNIQVNHIYGRLNPFVVQVSDTGENLVPNAPVQFEIVSRPPAAKDDSLYTMLAYTDSSGLASTTMILGDKQGEYRVRASIPNGKDTIFVAYAVLLLADVNHDNYRNIGDLTAIIDHILGKRILIGADFSRADMYPVRQDGTVGDGFVDIRDAIVCRDSLLNTEWNPTRDWMLTPEAFLSGLQGVVTVADSGMQLEESSTDSCNILLTHIGSRFVLKNTMPVKGLQAVIYMKNAVSIDTVDLVFSRAQMMNTEVQTVGNQVRILMWNTGNQSIEPGDSAIFRLPLQLVDDNVDSIHVVVSVSDTNSAMLLASVRQDVKNIIPREWRLYQNYPNPFNPTTTIEFDVPEVTGKIPRVAVQIFNILGQKITTLERGVYDVGRYRVTWNGTNEQGSRVASGVYFYRLLSGDYTSTKKMVLVK